MSDVLIDFKGGMEFEASARGHRVTLDLAMEKGGGDRGMNPPEAFVASLGACIGVYVAKYCETAHIDATGLQIALGYDLSEDKTSIGAVRAQITLPRAELGKRERAVLDAAHRCLIHNTLLKHPQIDITLEKA